MTGTLYGDKMVGVYDAKRKCLSFLRSSKPNSQAWIGYVFDGEGDHYTIAWSFQSFAFGKDVKRVEAGCYGTMPKK